MGKKEVSARGKDPVLARPAAMGKSPGAGGADPGLPFVHHRSRDMPWPGGLCTGRPDGEAGGTAEPEPPAARGPSGPDYDGDFSLRLGQACAHRSPILQKAQAGHGLDRPGGPGVQRAFGLDRRDVLCHGHLFLSSILGGPCLMFASFSSIWPFSVRAWRYSI